jgi:hypothetical protein
VMTDLINMHVLDLLKVLCVILRNVKHKVIRSAELIIGLLSSVNAYNVYSILLTAHGQTNNYKEIYSLLMCRFNEQKQ